MTTRSRHFARSISYDELESGLREAQAVQAVYRKTDASGLELWNYTQSCTYDRKWNPFSLVARGLILDPASRSIVATPFPKFFNLGEHGEGMPDEPFEVFEKLDGSLIILFHHQDRWRAATRGAFGTAQALWAEAVMATADLSHLMPGTTYLAEAVYAENRIIVRYDEDALVLLSAYDAEGFELPFAELAATGAAIGWRTARRHAFDSAEALIADAHGLPEQLEGYVVRFASGLRLKLKGPAYCALHAIIARVTPLGMWELMRTAADLDDIRRRIPEELWADFDAIRGTLAQALEREIGGVAAFAREVAHLSDREIGLMRGSIDPELFGRIFAYRKNPDMLSDPKSRERLFRDIRPDGNVLAGYEPSYAWTKIVGEAE